jgi:hypothetical protein
MKASICRLRHSLRFGFQKDHCCPQQPLPAEFRGASNGNFFPIRQRPGRTLPTGRKAQQKQVVFWTITGSVVTTPVPSPDYWFRSRSRETGRRKEVLCSCAGRWRVLNATNRLLGQGSVSVRARTPPLPILGTSSRTLLRRRRPAARDRNGQVAPTLKTGYGRQVLLSRNRSQSAGQRPHHFGKRGIQTSKLSHQSITSSSFRFGQWSRSHARRVSHKAP